MIEVFKLLGTIVIDASGVDTTLNDTSKKTGLFSEKVQKHFQRIAATAATVFSLNALKDFGQACVEAYADIAATESAFTQVMGDYSDQATAKLKGLEEQTGVVSSRMMNHFTMLTSRFVGRGYGIEEATDLAAKGMLVAADAAAFYNMSLDETVGHLNSFLNGSYEGGEAMGLYATATEMAQKAMDKGFDWDSFDEGEKQVFRMLDAVQQMEDSKVTGQSLFESGSYQNQLANMEAAVAQAQTTLGEPLMEDTVLPGLGKIQEILNLITDNKDAISEAISPLTEFLGGLATNGLELFKGALEWLVSNKDNLTGTINTISVAMVGLGLVTHPYITALSLVISKWDEITEAVDNAIIAVQRFFGINAGSGVEQGSSGTYHSGGGGSFESNAPVSTDAYTGGTSAGFWGFPHAKGLDNVPFDGYPAILHKKEAVLNATNAEVWRNGGGEMDISRLENAINSLSDRVYGIMQQVAMNTSAGQTIVLDTGAVVGQTVRQMDTELGNIATRKGRRN